MRAVARLAEPEPRAALNDAFAEGQERDEQIAEVHQFRTAAVQRHHVDAERRLQRREAVELVEHHIADRVALQLDDDAHAVAVGFVAQFRDALDALFAHEIGDLFDQRRLVHLIRDFGDDDGFAVLAKLFDRRASAHHDRAAARRIGRADAGAAEDHGAGREIRPRHDLVQRFDFKFGIVDQRQGRIDDLAEIVRRDVRRHADGDAARAVGEQVRKARGQNLRLALGIVVVVLEVDRVFVDVGEQRESGLRKPHLGVTHRGRRIAVDRAEIALPVDEQDAHGKFLRHTYKRIIDRLVAVRMVFTDDVADDARGFAVRLVGRVAVFVHRKQDAPVHRLQPVAGVRQRAAHDHAHRVIEIAALHLVGDGDGLDVGCGSATRRRFDVGHDDKFTLMKTGYR